LVHQHLKKKKGIEGIMVKASSYRIKKGSRELYQLHGQTKKIIDSEEKK
jgi:hypothetical protein